MNQLEQLFAAADAHGSDTGEIDHTIGDLQDLLRHAWRQMNDAQRAGFIVAADSVFPEVALPDAGGKADAGKLPTVIVEMEGGLIQLVTADRPTRVVILDADTEGADAEQLVTVGGVATYCHDFGLAKTVAGTGLQESCVAPEYVGRIIAELATESSSAGEEADGTTASAALPSEPERIMFVAFASNGVTRALAIKGLPEPLRLRVMGVVVDYDDAAADGDAEREDHERLMLGQTVSEFATEAVYVW